MRKIIFGLILLVFLVGCMAEPLPEESKEESVNPICTIYYPINFCNLTYTGEIKCESINDSLTRWNEQFGCNFIECETTKRIDGKIYGACIK